MPLKGEALAVRARELPGWEVVDEHHLHKAFEFPDFKKALDFVNCVGAIAEEQNHHPDISLGWGKAEITTYSHDADGLTDRDFILAAAIDRISG